LGEGVVSPTEETPRLLLLRPSGREKKVACLKGDELPVWNEATNSSRPGDGGFLDFLVLRPRGCSGDSVRASEFLDEKGPFNDGVTPPLRGPAEMLCTDFSAPKSAGESSPCKREGIAGPIRCCPKKMLFIPPCVICKKKGGYPQVDRW